MAEEEPIVDTPMGDASKEGDTADGNGADNVDATQDAEKAAAMLIDAVRPTLKIKKIRKNPTSLTREKKENERWNTR